MAAPISSHIAEQTDLSWLVVSVAIGEHGLEVLDALGRRVVEVRLEALFNRPHVHRVLDDLVVILGTDRTRTLTTNQNSAHTQTKLHMYTNY